MPIDLVNFYTYFFNPHNFYEYLFQTNHDDYEAKNKDIKVRENPLYVKSTILVTINEVNMHYSKDGLKQIIAVDQKRWKC